MVLGLINALMNSYQAYAAKAAVEAGKESVTYNVVDYIVDVAMDVINGVIDSVVDVWSFLGDLFSGTLSPSPIGLNDVSGFIDNMSQAFNLYQEFFPDEGLEPVIEEQTSKSNQFPEEMFASMEMIVYQPDALQKMDMLKEQSLGGNKTQSFLDEIA